MLVIVSYRFLNYEARGRVFESPLVQTRALLLIGAGEASR
jgi:hypothetical protein